MKNLFFLIGSLRRHTQWFTGLRLLALLPLLALATSCVTVTTDAPSNITFNSARLGGEATAGSGTSVAERGVVYSTTNASPTTGTGSTKVIISGTGDGKFSQVVTGLLPNQKYYTRAYANSSGSSPTYGTTEQFTTPDGPYLASLSPANGAVGTSVTLTGTGLTGVMSVSFNGTAATTFAVINATTVTATVPPGATTGDVTVTTPLGTSNALGFVVGAPTNNALAFDGADDYVALGSPASLSNLGLSGGTFEAWVNVNLSGANTKNSLIRKDGDYSLVIFNGQPYVEVWPQGTGNSAHTYLYGTTNLTAGRWQHLAATWDGTSLRLYLDGVDVSGTQNAGPATANSQLQLGRSATYGEALNGRLDEVRIYNTPLTLAQVQADRFSASGASAVPASQVYYANFDQGVAGGNNTGFTSLTDQSGSGNTGTLTNFALTGTTSNRVRSFPTITAVNPTSGAAGTSISITGTNLTDATGFAFNGTTTIGFATPTSDLTATVTVPPGATTGPVSVTSAVLTRYNGPAFTVNATPPTVVSVLRQNPTAALTNATALTYRLTFSEAVTGVSIDDFSLTGTGTANGTVSAVAAMSTSVYDVTVTSDSGDGTLRLDLNSTNTGIVGLTGSALAGGYTSGQAYTLDQTPPVATISTTATNPTSTSPIPFAVGFSEAVTGFSASSVTVTNGTITTAITNVGNAYSFSITPTGNGAVTVSVVANAVQDVAGNGNPIAGPVSITYTALPVTLTTWTGAKSSDWYTAGNWTAGMPTATIDAIVPVVSTNRYPLIGAGTASVRSLTLNSGASLIQSGGTISLQGNLSNAGTLASSGTLLFNGTANQVFTPGTATVANLTLSNTGATDANSLFLTQDLTLGTLLTLTQGMLRTQASDGSLHTLRLLDEASVVGEGPGQYVQGCLQVARAHVNSSTGSIDFTNGLVLNPNGQDLGPVTVTRTAGLQQAGVSYGTNIAGSTKGIDRVWQVTSGQPVATATPASVTLSWVSDDDNGFNPATPAQLWRADQASGPWAPQGTSASASARSFTANTTQLGTLTVSNTSQPLPVTLVNFTAQAQGPDGLLSWRTASEFNNAYFQVESSVDGTTFLPLPGRVAGAGTSTLAHDYTATDKNLARYGAPQVYYRLRQVDTNGTSSYSPVGTVQVPLAAGLALFPNPTRAAATLTGAQPGAVVVVLDAVGRTVTTFVANASGTAVLDLPQPLASGVYVVRTGSSTLRLTVE